MVGVKEVIFTGGERGTFVSVVNLENGVLPDEMRMRHSDILRRHEDYKLKEWNSNFGATFFYECTSNNVEERMNYFKGKSSDTQSRLDSLLRLAEEMRKDYDLFVEFSISQTDECLKRTLKNFEEWKDKQ